MSYDDWLSTEPDPDRYEAKPDPPEEEVGDGDLDWDSEDPRDPGPERPANPPPLISPGGGPPASPGPLTPDPDEPTSSHGDSPVEGDYM